MPIATCRLTLHDTVFYATREMGTLFETERFLHNYALSYALFNDRYIQVPYFAATVICRAISSSRIPGEYSGENAAPIQP